MIAWIESLPEGGLALPSTLIVRGVSPEERRALLRALAARALGLDPARVAVRHAPGRAPAVIRPAEAGLRLSSASRAGTAALAVATTPVGVDVERADPAAAVPWRVLHPAEAAMLVAVPHAERARAFARLWSLKEAYLKALGLGLSREPASFAVRLIDEERAAVEDALRPAADVTARSAWREDRGLWTTISTVVIGGCGAGPRA